MKKNGFSHIRRWLLLYVIIVVLTTLTAYLYVYNELTNMLSASAWTASDTIANNTVQKTAPPFPSGIKLRILLLLSISLLVIFFLSMLWLRAALHQINRPIHAIRRAVFRLAQGKLNETVTLESNDELGQIGSGINELAANLQELLLHIWKQTGLCISVLDHIKNDAKQLDRNTTDQLHELTAAIENLRDMAKAYVFYDVRLDGEQAVAINRPGQKEQPASPPSRSSLSK